MDPVRAAKNAVLDGAWPPPDVDAVLRKAGWTPDRWHPLSEDEWVRRVGPGFTWSPAAHDALARFAGIRVEQSGPGVAAARGTFEFRPEAALGEDDRFEWFRPIIHTGLFPLGEMDGGHAFLAVARDGRVYALMDEAWRVGETIEDEITALVRGTAITKLGSL